MTRAFGVRGARPPVCPLMSISSCCRTPAAAARVSSRDRHGQLWRASWHSDSFEADQKDRLERQKRIESGWMETRGCWWVMLRCQARISDREFRLVPRSRRWAAAAAAASAVLAMAVVASIPAATRTLTWLATRQSFDKPVRCNLWLQK